MPNPYNPCLCHCVELVVRENRIVGAGKGEAPMQEVPEYAAGIADDQRRYYQWRSKPFYALETVTLRRGFRFLVAKMLSTGKLQPKHLLDLCHDGVSHYYTPAARAYCFKDKKQRR